MELTAKEQAVLEFISNFIKTNRYPPSVRDIGKGVGYQSTATVQGYINRLVEKGKLRRADSKSRTLEVVEKEKMKEMMSVPVVGKVAAGLPILAQENIEDTFPVPYDFIGHTDSEVFMLRIQGESMVEAGILDKDYVLIKQQNTCENGEIVVAMVDDGATVKRFFRENGHIRLQPENKTMKPIIVPNASVLGKVIGVFRKM